MNEKERKELVALLSLMDSGENKCLVDQYPVHYFLSNETNRTIYFCNLDIQLSILRVSESKFILHIYIVHIKNMKIT